jgi:hypothetical protein
MKKAPQEHVRYEVIVQEDPDSDDLILPIPQVMLDELGWKEGDDIEFILDDGRWILKRVSK